MKKNIVLALTTAMVAGSAVTAMAASNPFSDVPADHWAYDAVAELAQDGVINGYAVDNTFRGNQNMSRYEMAQIVAKGMARVDSASNNQKALLDKLSAEFSDELANLGVRVANLESKVDNVTWNGRFRYDWNNINFAGKEGHRTNETNRLRLRLEPSMAINEHWTGKVQIKADVFPDDNRSGDLSLVKAYALGKYGKTEFKLGKFDHFSDASHGFVMDTEITGAEVIYHPTDAWTLKATGGRIQSDYKDVYKSTDNGGNTYLSAEAVYAKDKWDAGVGYRHMSSTYSYQDVEPEGGFGLVDIGLGYKFDKNVHINGEYVFGPSLNNPKFKDTAKNGYSIELGYKGANKKDKGSWGTYIAYRNFTPFTAMYTTYSVANGADWMPSLKGFEVGVSYAWEKNIVSQVKYFTGKDTLAHGDDAARGVWTRTEFFF